MFVGKRGVESAKDEDDDVRWMAAAKRGRMSTRHGRHVERLAVICGCQARQNVCRQATRSNLRRKTQSRLISVRNIIRQLLHRSYFVIKYIESHIFFLD